MQPQLFLFDEEEANNSREMTGGVDAYPSEQVATDVLVYNNTGAPDTTGTLINENLFAEVQKKQQDKIENLLLTTGRKKGRKSFKEMDEESILPEVPDDAILYQKQYYPTRVVADWFGITATQLRAWENEFEILKPKRNGKGDRFFRPDDVKNLKLIYHLIRIRKFTVQGARQYMEENQRKLQTTMQLTESLTRFRQFLLELKAISG